MRVQALTKSLALVGLLIAACHDSPVETAVMDAHSKAFALGSVSPALSTSLDPGATFTYLPLPFGSTGVMYAINDAGLAVGSDASNRAVVWTASGGYVVMGNIDGSGNCCSYFKGVNASGVAVGADDAGIQLWSQATNIRSTLGPNVGFGINDNGDVVGHSDPFFIPNGGARTQLALGPDFIHGYIGEGRAINNSRAIVGYLWGPSGLTHAVVWPDPYGPVVDLGSLGGDQALANSINNAGDIVGWSELSHGSAVRHAVLWPATGGMIDLTTWPNPCTGSSEANGANNQGFIVGTCDGQPVLWTAAQGMRLLSLPADPGNGEAPSAVNSHLQVAGRGGIWQLRPDQTITFGALGGKTFGDPSFDVSASASSGLTVSFTASGNCTVTGGTVQLTGAGACTITAEQGGNGLFSAAPSVSRGFAIGRATPVINWVAPSSIIFGTALNGSELNATATGVDGGSLAGNFTYAPPAGTVLPVGLGQNLSVTFTPTDAADYLSAASTVRLDVVFAVAVDKNQCKDNGWQTVQRADGTVFKNQSNCIQYVNNGH